MTGSYGFWLVVGGQDYYNHQPLWADTVKSGTAAAVPILYDSTDWLAYGFDKSPPPRCDDLPWPEAHATPWGNLCINRHNGGVNYLFLDWSARKVGLKELWTLKWGQGYDTHGPWTKAGGVKPEDWPQWMRGFKDY